MRAFEIPVKEARATIKSISDDQGTVSTQTIRGCLGVMVSVTAIGSDWCSKADKML